MIAPCQRMDHPLARSPRVNDGDQADAWKELTMQSQPTSLIMLAEVRHAELQAEAAQERLAMQALTKTFPATSIVAGVRRRLGITLAGVGTLIHDGLTFLRARQRTTVA
jgi:hypothetical protein